MDLFFLYIERERRRRANIRSLLFFLLFSNVRKDICFETKYDLKHFFFLSPSFSLFLSLTLSSFISLSHSLSLFLYFSLSLSLVLYLGEVLWIALNGKLFTSTNISNGCRWIDGGGKRESNDGAAQVSSFQAVWNNRYNQVLLDQVTVEQMCMERTCIAWSEVPWTGEAGRE